jgi:hypothetical protein
LDRRQQRDTLGGCSSGAHSPTIWLNRIHALRSARRTLRARDMVLSRFGGLGSHRYPVGFSGGVDQLSWSRSRSSP